MKWHPSREPWEPLHRFLLARLVVVVALVVVKGPKSVLSHPRNTIASERKEHSWGKIRHGQRHRGFGIVAVAALVVVVADVVVDDDDDHVAVHMDAVVPVRIVDVDVGAVVVVVVVVVVAPVIEEDVQERYNVPFCNSTIESSHPLPSHMPSIPLEGETTEQ